LRLENCVLFLLNQDLLEENLLVLLFDIEFGLQGGVLLDHLLVLCVDFVCDVLYPLQFGHHLFLFLVILLVFLGLVYLVLLELVLDLVDLLVEESTDVALLLD